MKITLLVATVCLFFTHDARAQSSTPAGTPHSATTPSAQESSDVEELRADIQRLKALINQMRTNLAFVQSSQTPLKHQFELEADAWQVVVEQMERRLKRMEDSRPAGH